MIRCIEAIQNTNGDMDEASRVDAAVLRISTGEWVSTTNGTSAYDPTFVHASVRMVPMAGKTDLELKQ